MSTTTTNEEEEDPYKILKVPPDATQQQIKSSYRKLALQYHPDKQRTEEDRRKATQIFAKISGAYEILSDETLRHDYDLAQQQQQQQQQQSQRHHQHQHHHSGFRSDPFHHPFFQSRNGAFHFGGEGFMDPFDLFNQVFAEELGHLHTRTHRQNRHASSHHHHHHHQHQQQQHSQHHSQHYAQHQQAQQQTRSRDPFDDPFFSSGFGTSFGGASGGAFAMMDQMMSSHRSMMHDMMNSTSSMMMTGMESNLHQQMMMDMGRAGSSSSSYSTSSSSSSLFGGNGGIGGRSNGVSESVSTTTRIVNGRRQTVTERIVTKADGSVERRVETTSGHRHEQIGNGLGGGGSGRYLRY